jgi:hypothetical protein
LTRASCAQLPSAREVRQRQRKDTHVLGSDWNLSSAPPLSEGTNDNAAFANDSGKEGKPGIVLLQKSKTKFEKVWTYDQSSAGSDLPIASRTPESEKLKGTLG